MFTPQRDLQGLYESAELTACVVTTASGYRNALSVLVFSKEPPKHPRFKFLTSSPQSLGASHAKVLIARSELTAEEASSLVGIGAEYYVDPAVPKSTLVACPGIWSGAELVGEDEGNVVRECLPVVSGAFWVDERCADGQLAVDLGARATQDLVLVVRGHLGIDLERRAERIGNFIVVWPEYRIRAAIGVSDDWHQARVEVRTQGIDRADLMLSLRVLRDHEALQGMQSAVHPVANLYRFPQDVSKYAIEIHHRRSGDLLYRRDGMFLRQIHSTVNMITKPYHFHLNLTRPDGTVVGALDVRGNWGSSVEVNVGNQPEAERRREGTSKTATVDGLRRSGRLFIYTGGDSQRALAVSELRALIGQHGRGGVKAWDPYFGARDLVEFLTAVFDPNVSVRLLTHVDLVPGEQMVAGEAGGRRAPRKRKLDELAKMIQMLRGVGMSNLHGRVARTPAHDRFLLMDGRCWQLGCSFNQIGKVVGTVVELPIANAIEAEFDAAWDGAGPQAEIEVVST